MLTGWSRLDEICFPPCLCYFILGFLLILQQILMDVSNVLEMYVDYRTNTRDTHYMILKKFLLLFTVKQSYLIGNTLCSSVKETLF